MFIHEAIKEALEKNLYITVPEFKEVKIKPTNGRRNCILMNADGSDQSNWGWQPKADDLLRGDWVVVS